jgi:hypothetical protein
VDWIDLAQDRDRWRVLLNMVQNLRFQYNAGQFLSSCTTGGLSRRNQLYEYRVSYIDCLFCFRLF